MKTPFPHLLLLLCLGLSTVLHIHADDHWGKDHDSRLNNPRPKGVPPPTDALLRQIQSDFVQLPLPLEVKFEKRWDGDGSYWHRALLHGDAKLFQYQYQPEDIVLALWSYIDDEQHGNEAGVIIAAVTESTADGWVHYRADKNTPAWAKDRKNRLIGVRGDARGMLQSRGGPWVRSFSDRKPKVTAEELLPYSIKKKKRLGSWFSRLFR
ncbi:hypothetical protein [Prosthecobacter sp.]|uniref:hypothetical protein n=1 Tax=Prosthecobacter sp. TaxID=1965333 RepID=UPI003783B9F7